MKVGWTCSGAMCLAIFGTGIVSAQCVRHFYNRSNYAWSISGYDGAKPAILVNPGAAVEIPWGDTKSVVISGDILNRPFARKFTVESSGDCVTIVRMGNTGSVTINKPNLGDVTTCVGGC